MRFGLIRLIKDLFALTIRVGQGLTADREWILPGSVPTQGQSARVSNITGNTITWEYFTPSSGSGGSGTVTSVGLTAPQQFAVTGSPVTSNGTLGLTWVNQNVNLVLASPVSGGAGVPTFRSLVDADLPAGISANKLTGLIPVGNLPIGTTANTLASGNDPRFHAQNTDTATNSPSFQIDVNNSGVILRNGGNSTLELRNSNNSSPANLVVGNLTVNGTTTTINTQELNIADNFITLNSDAPANAAPTENAGIEVYRGNQQPARILWNETTDKFMIGISGSEFDILRIREFNFTSNSNAIPTQVVSSSGMQTLTVTHNLGRRPVFWKIWDNSNSDFTGGATTSNENTIVFSLGDVTISGTWTAVIAG